MRVPVSEPPTVGRSLNRTATRARMPDKLADVPQTDIVDGRFRAAPAGGAKHVARKEAGLAEAPATYETARGAIEA